MGRESICLQCRRHRQKHVRSLGWEDSLEEGMATHSSILAWRILMDRGPGGLQSPGHKELDRTERLSTAQHRAYLSCSIETSRH